MVKLLLYTLALSSVAFAQAVVTTPVWFPVTTPAQQATTLSVTIPAGTIYRIGDSLHNKWCVQQTPAKQITIIDFADGRSRSALWYRPR